jgi:hypothetical protein
MSEATHKAALCKVLRSAMKNGGRVYRHEDQFTGGIPDISISFEGRTAWVEVKLDRPGRKSKVSALQLAALRDLHGYLLTFIERKGDLTAVVQSSSDIQYALSGVVYMGRKKSYIYNELAGFFLRKVGAV